MKKLASQQVEEESLAGQRRQIEALKKARAGFEKEKNDAIEEARKEEQKKTKNEIAELQKQNENKMQMLKEEWESKRQVGTSDKAVMIIRCLLLGLSVGYSFCLISNITCLQRRSPENNFVLQLRKVDTLFFSQPFSPSFPDSFNLKVRQVRPKFVKISGGIWKKSVS